MNSMQQNLYICMLNLNTKYQMYRKQHLQPSGTDLGEVSAPFVISQRAVGLKCTFR